MEEAAAGRDAAPDAILAAALDAATGGGASGPPAEAANPAAPHRRRAADAPRGRSVQVVIRADAAMRGLARCSPCGGPRSLGLVSGLRPSVGQLEREEFDGRIGFRIESRATDEELAAAIRSAGEVEPWASRSRVPRTRAAPSATARSGWISAGSTAS